MLRGKAIKGSVRPPEGGNHLPKHVGVNLEYIDKVHWLLGAFCWPFTTILQKMLGQTLRMEGLVFGNVNNISWICGRVCAELLVGCTDPLLFRSDRDGYAVWYCVGLPRSRW
jgi:hypothetical protein